MESTLNALQQALFEQLTSKPLDTQANDAKSALKQLKAATSSKKVLIVCDDLWLDEQYAALDCVNHANGSKLLLTSRMRDVVCDALTIDLTILDKEEAAALLMRTACLGEAPANARPPAIDEISRECAYLPLTIVLAGKVIASYGQGWEQDVLPLLKESHSEELRLSGLSGLHDKSSHSSVENHIISVTLRTIRGPQAADVQRLFRLMALFAEDALVPIPAIVFMVESQSDVQVDVAVERRRVQLKIRERVNILLGRSLLLGSLHSGIKVGTIN